MSAYTAVIVEPRCHRALSFVLQNILTNLPDEWSILIVHGQTNKDYVETIIQNELVPFQNRILTPIQLNVDNLTIKQYNAILMSQSFYYCIPTETFLVFQTDTVILEKNKSLLSSFLKYDYVGAPWRTGNVGNGGFSLRKKSKMLEICNTIWPRQGICEDVYFTCQLVVPMYMPTWEEAKSFSVECIFCEKSFGIHAAWKYMTPSELQFLVEMYPEIQTLINLQSAF
jgi:hypothetical protein